MTFLRRPLSGSSVVSLVVTLFTLLFSLTFASALVGCGRSAFDDQSVDDASIDTGSGGETSIDSGLDTCSGSGCSDTILPDVPPDSPRTLVAINIEPASITVPVGSIGVAIARGFYSDGTSDDVTSTATWTSDNAAVATVPKPGAVEGNGPGSARIRATITGTLGPIFGEADVLVPSAPITDLQLAPSFADLTIGGTLRFTATAFFADGTKADVSSSSTWTIVTGSFATVDATGLVTGVSVGGGGVQAAFDGRTALAKLSVSNRTVASIEISPFTPTLAIGSSTPFIATAIFTDGSKADVTTTSTWTSSSTDVLSIVASGTGAGTATAFKAGTSAISATFSGITGFTTATVTGSPLTGIAVSPTSATISPGATVTLVATANFADGTSTDVTGSAIWKTTDSAIATVSTGLVTGAGVGSATISATFGGFTGNATITVSPAKLVSVTCGPDPLTVAIGLTGSLKATGTYEGGVVRDVTGDVSWSTDDVTIATVGPTGLVTPVAVGATKAHAKLGGLDGVCGVVVSTATVASITIAPNPLALVLGTKQFVTATAKLTDGTTIDVTTTCTWASANEKVATVSNGAGAQGQVTATGAGSTTISCTSSGITGSGTVNVTGSTLEQVTISPIAPTCVVGDTLQFFATAISTGGTSSNVTFAATWTSDAPTIVQALGAPGRFRCVATGTANVSATYLGKTGSTPVTVSAATVVSIQIDPADTTMAVGDVQQYQAVAILSDGTSQNVTLGSTWLSTVPSVASVVSGGGPRGRVTALKAGTTTIQATYKGVTGSTTLTVSSATIVSISINPASVSVPAGTTFQYTAQAIYSDGTSKDVTNLATWLAGTTSVAQVSDAGGSKGRATTFAAGTTSISATFSGVKGTALLTVSAATLVSVQVTPFSASEAPGTPVQYRADAIFSDGTSGDVTAGSTWTSTDSSIASVSDAIGSKGRANTLKAGSVKIHAQYKGIIGEASLTVTSATLTTIQITAFRPTIPLGFGVRLTATGIYSDGSKSDLTGLATWTSSDTSVAAVSDAGATKGRVTTVAAGTATIKASWAGVTGTDDVTVSSATLTTIAITPDPSSVPVGGSTALLATGTFSDGTTLDITQRVTWISSDPTIADVSNAGDTTGFVFGFKVGTITVTAQSGSVKGTSTANIGP